MSHRRISSGRFFSRADQTSRGFDRRNPAGSPYTGDERRQQHRRRSSRALPRFNSQSGSFTPPLPTAPTFPIFVPPTDREIAELATQLYVQSNCRPGHDVEFWLEAETRLWLKATQVYHERQLRIWEEYRLALEQELQANPENYDERLWVRRISWNDPPQ